MLTFEKVTSVYTILYSNYAVFFGDDERGNRKTTRVTTFTLVCREVSYILPRVPYPAQANEHLSQPHSACIIQKLDFPAKETFTAALPPSGF